MADKNMKNHPVVSRTEWLAVRAEHEITMKVTSRFGKCRLAPSPSGTTYS
jgi:hypothetical protein